MGYFDGKHRAGNSQRRARVLMADLTPLFDPIVAIVANGRLDPIVAIVAAVVPGACRREAG
jgi:hypothetical protein